MIIYGSKMYGVRNVVHTEGFCEACGKRTKQKSYDGRKFGHIYFIPLFPVSGRVRVLQECKGCGMGNHLPEDAEKAVFDSIASRLDMCLEVVERGEHEFNDPEDNEPIETGPFLANAVEMLTVLNYGDTVDQTVAKLQPDSYEGHCVRATQLELKGDMNGAFEAMQQAVRVLPDSVWPVVTLAGYAGQAGRHQDQIALLDRGIEIADNEAVDLKLMKLAPLEALKEFGQAVQVMDECIGVAPELGEDKDFMKSRKKFAKKATKLGQM